jgi:hypothetical protein
VLGTDLISLQVIVGELRVYLNLTQGQREGYLDEGFPIREGRNSEVFDKVPLSILVDKTYRTGKRSEVVFGGLPRRELFFGYVDHGLFDDKVLFVAGGVGKVPLFQALVDDTTKS